MGWATHYIDKLKKGETITFKAPNGSSMKPKINPQDTVTIEPVQDHSTLVEGDMVLCKVGKRQFLHLITSIQGSRFQISNNHGHVNGWVGTNGIFGKVIRVA
jgi:hypothetical protein